MRAGVCPQVRMRAGVCPQVSLKRWGFTPQKPIKVAYEQKPEAVKKWLDEDEEYPAISAGTKAEKAEIHWADVTAAMNTE